MIGSGNWQSWGISLVMWGAIVYVFLKKPFGPMSRWLAFGAAAFLIYQSWGKAKALASAMSGAVPQSGTSF